MKPKIAFLFLTIMEGRPTYLYVPIAFVTPRDDEMKHL